MKTKKKISAFSVILGFVCLSLVGISMIPRLAIKLSPSQELPSLTVNFSMHGSSPRTVEIEATTKLEAMLNRIDGVRKISSKSGNGWGRVQIEFHKHKPMDIARFEASAVIRQIWPLLPPNVSYPALTQSRTEKNANKPFLVYTINAPAIPHDIQKVAERMLKPQLSLIPGVTQVDIRGASPMLWRLQYDADQLIQYGITIKDIQRAVNKSLEQEFLDIAPVQEGTDVEWLRVTLHTPDRSDMSILRTIGVKQVDGTIISLDKLVQVDHVEQEAQSYFRINGLNSIYLSLSATEESNQIKLAGEIQKQLEVLKKLLPSGYEVHLNYDATEYLRKELDKIYFRTGLTLAILLLFVLMTYRNLKYILLITGALVSNLATAAILYYLLGVEIQIYSMAGITISLTLMIDNTIVMADHIIRRKNLRAFMSLLAATATTVGTLSVVFLLDEKSRLNLLDFATVIIINLVVSLLIALFLVPALLEKLRIRQQVINKRLDFSAFYRRLCMALYRWRTATIVLLILAFGLPVFLLPEKVEGDSRWHSLYNITLGSETYKEDVAPYVNGILGGTLRLFVQKVKHGSYFEPREETNLYVSASLPSHATMEEMNGLVQQMENYISQFAEIKQFQTEIQSARQASISIQFLDDHAATGFPHALKAKLISKSLELGGGSWGVHGLGDGFSNDVREGAGSYRIEMYGYNYDELIDLADQFKKKLMEHRRIKEVEINAEFSWFKDDYEEYSFMMKRERLAEESIQPYNLYEQLRVILGRDIHAGAVKTSDGVERIQLQAMQAEQYHVWDMLYIPIKANQRMYKLSELVDIQKVKVPQEIGKVNQQYRLCLQYEYIGAHEQGQKVQDNYITDFKEQLPMGYTMKNANPQYNTDKDSNTQYYLLLYVILVIYVVCCILFNSFRKPLYIIFVIPISFIGIFLTFYLFSIDFDQGGYASFILLSALTINANIYILDEYTRMRQSDPSCTALQAYIRASQNKIRPILLTVFSTILGLIPFLIGDGKEAFWFPLAAGTIGGLVISTLATLLFLPLFMGVAKDEYRLKTT